MGEGFLIRRGISVKGDAEASHVLAGKTFSSKVAGIGVTGTMPNNGAVVITPGTSNITIPAGYHNGSGYVKGDANLIPDNIVEGKSIFGVTGTAQRQLALLIASSEDTVDNLIGFVTGYTSGSGGSVEWDYYYLRLEASRSSEISIVTPQAIDLTNFNYLYVVGRCSASYDGYVVVSPNKLASYTDYTARIALFRIASGSLVVGHKLNIRSLSGSYYIRIHARNDEKAEVSAMILV